MFEVTGDSRSTTIDKPVTETPLQKRDRLRDTVRARGINPSSIETIDGDCENQKATQIRELEAWLAKS